MKIVNKILLGVTGLALGIGAGILIKEAVKNYKEMDKEVKNEKEKATKEYENLKKEFETTKEHEDLNKKFNETIEQQKENNKASNEINENEESTNNENEDDIETTLYKTIIVFNKALEKVNNKIDELENDLKDKIKMDEELYKVVDKLENKYSKLLQETLEISKDKKSNETYGNISLLDMVTSQNEIASTKDFDFNNKVITIKERVCEEVEEEKEYPDVIYETEIEGDLMDEINVKTFTAKEENGEVVNGRQ